MFFNGKIRYFNHLSKTTRSYLISKYNQLRDKTYLGSFLDLLFFFLSTLIRFALSYLVPRNLAKSCPFVNCVLLVFEGFTYSFLSRIFIQHKGFYENAPYVTAEAIKRQTVSSSKTAISIGLLTKGASKRSAFNWNP